MKRFNVERIKDVHEAEESGKPNYNTGNRYLVVNIDEPYAGQVFELIKAAEKEKGTWDGPETFKAFVEG